jgi:hypothetical protein
LWCPHLQRIIIILDSVSELVTTYQLDQYATVTLDGSGNGVASLGPSIVREHWQPLAATVSVSIPSGQANPTLEAKCVLYLGTTIQSATVFSTTFLGSSGATAGFQNQDLPPGYQIFAKWTGGDAGQVATLHVTGARTAGSPS